MITSVGPARKPAYFLVTDTRGAVAELMAKCPACGAITREILELAWRTRLMTCQECRLALSITEDVLDLLRNQAIGALAAIDRLRQLTRKPANE